MADIRSFEPLWGEWRSVKLLSQGVTGKVYLFEKTGKGKPNYAAVKHISIPDVPEKGKVTGAGSSDGSAGDSDGKYQRELDTLIAEINKNYRLEGGENIVAFAEHQVVPRKNAPGYDVFIRMELLDSLNDYIKHNGFTVENIVKLGEDICSALALLRQEKMLPREIKPDSIFVGKDGNFKLGDIGLPRGKAGKGSLSFLSPEASKGEETDDRTDLYSLGLVLYRLMNHNRGPFLPQPPDSVNQKLNNAAQKRRLKGDELPPPALADSGLTAIVLKSCAYKPDDRWESAELMFDALAGYRRSLDKEYASHVVLEWNREGGEIKSGAAPVHNGMVSAAKGKAKKTKNPSANKPHKPNTEQTVIEAKPSPPAEAEVLLLPEEQTVPSSEELPQQHFEEEASPQPAAEVYQPAEEEAYTPAKAEAFAPLIDKETDSVLAYRKTLVPEKKEEPKKGHLKKRERVYAVSLVLGAVFISIAVIVIALYSNQHGGKALNSGAPTGNSKPSAGVSASGTINRWQDPVIEAGVRQALGIKKGSIASEDLAGLIELRLTGSSEPISTLADLEKLPGLKTLDLSGHPVKQMDIPDGMAEITALNLTGCGCADLSFLQNAKLNGLISLAVGSNGASELKALKGLKQLQYLNISGNPVQDLTPLSGLPELRTLIAQNVNVLDWSPVDGVETVDGRPAAAPATTTPETPEPQISAPPSQAPPSPKPTVKPTAKPTPSTTAITSVSLSRSSLLLTVGDRVTLTAQISPSNATGRKITWSSSAPSVAKVDSNGNVSAVGNGTAIITATCGGCSDSCAISIG